MRNRFNIFAAEEFDDSVVDGQGQVSETPVADQIESENSAVEINNEISTFEEHCDEVCSATEVADELQEQVDAQEEILEEKPEEVTEDTVAVAQEQFYITMSKIGSLQHYKTSGTISHEISAGTPTERLKLTCEGVKDFIEKVWEKIKAFFKKIVDWFKSILQKLGIIKNQAKKSSKDLKEEISDIAKKNNVSEQEVIATTVEYIEKNPQDEKVEKAMNLLVESIGCLNIAVPNFKDIINKFIPSDIVEKSYSQIVPFLEEGYSGNFLKSAKVNDGVNFLQAQKMLSKESAELIKKAAIKQGNQYQDYTPFIVGLNPKEMHFVFLKVTEEKRLSVESVVYNEFDWNTSNIKKRQFEIVEAFNSWNDRSCELSIEVAYKNAIKYEERVKKIQSMLDSTKAKLKAKYDELLFKPESLYPTLGKLCALTLSGMTRTYKSFNYYKAIFNSVRAVINAVPNWNTKLKENEDALKAHDNARGVKKVPGAK